LRQGRDFNITRLTSLKSLCAEPQAAAQFCLYLAQLTQERLLEKEKPDHLTEEIWLRCKVLIDQAIPAMKLYLAKPTPETERPLRTLFSNLQDVNNQYQNQAWGSVRIIQSIEVLLIEKALCAILRPAESDHWGYQMARDYAGRYSPRCGNGLIPESAPMVEDIANFWCQYHFGKPLSEWLRGYKRR
jgi:hypothetical protein